MENILTINNLALFTGLFLPVIALIAVYAIKLIWNRKAKKDFTNELIKVNFIYWSDYNPKARPGYKFCPKCENTNCINNKWCVVCKEPFPFNPIDHEQSK